MPMPDRYYVAKVVLFELERVAPDLPPRDEEGNLQFQMTHRGLPVAIGPDVESCLNAIDLRNYGHWENAEGLTFKKFDEGKFKDAPINPDENNEEPPFNEDCLHSCDGVKLRNQE